MKCDDPRFALAAEFAVRCCHLRCQQPVFLDYLITPDAYRDRLDVQQLAAEMRIEYRALLQLLDELERIALP